MFTSVADGLAIEIPYPRFIEEQYCIPQRIHGTGIFTYIYHKNQLNVGKYTIHGSSGYQLA